MHSLDERTTSGLVGVAGSRRAFSASVYCTAVAVVEMWDTTTDQTETGAVLRQTLAGVANDMRERKFHGAAFARGIYVRIVSGTGVRVAVEHGV